MMRQRRSRTISTKRSLRRAVMGVVMVVTGLMGLSAAAETEADAKAAGPVTYVDLLDVKPLLDENFQAPPSEEGELVIEYAARRWFEPGKSTPKMVFTLDPQKPPVADTHPRMVVLSGSDGQSPAYVVLGRGRGIEAAIDDGIGRLKTAVGSEATTIQWLKLDVIQKVGRNQQVPLDKPTRIERTLVGFAFDGKEGAFFVPEESVMRVLVSRGRALQVDNINDYLAVRRPIHKTTIDAKSKPTIYYFTTASYFATAKHRYRLFRGHRMWRRVTGDELRTAAQATGAYLQRSIDKDGRFIHIYLTKSGKAHDSYDIEHHAGACYALLQLYKVTGDMRLLSSIERALDYLKKQARPMRYRGGAIAAIVEDEQITLSATSMAVIAMAEHEKATRSRKYHGTMVDLAKWIRAVQRSGGSFAIHRQSAKTGKVARYKSADAPGQAMLAMVRMYGVTGEKEWLNAAAATADYLIHVRDKDLLLTRLPRDHWQVLALAELYPHHKQDAYRQRVMFLAAAMLQDVVTNPVYPDWLGAASIPPRADKTARHAEGLIAAAELLSAHGDDAQKRAVPQIVEGADRSVRFVMQCQLRPEQAMYLQSPQEPLGGVFTDPEGLLIRIDYCQHAISAMLGYRALRATDDARR